MKITLESIVISAKLFCVFAGTALLTLQTGLGALSQSDKAVTNIQWVMVVGGSLGTGLTAAGAFLSNAFGDYMNKADINLRTLPVVPPLPPMPKAEIPNTILTEAKTDDKVKSVL